MVAEEQQWLGAGSNPELEVIAAVGTSVASRAGTGALRKQRCYLVGARVAARLVR